MLYIKSINVEIMEDTEKDETQDCILDYQSSDGKHEAIKEVDAYRRS